MARVFAALVGRTAILAADASANRFLFLNRLRFGAGASRLFSSFACSFVAASIFSGASHAALPFRICLKRPRLREALLVLV